jgi:four helix bundle protein
MPTFKRFEDILVWQKSREATKTIYLLTAEGPFCKDFGLSDQLRRASVSIMANIAEGFGRRSDKEFANFLNMAYASAAECQSHLYVALDIEYISKPVFDQLYLQFTDISKMTISLSHHLRRT